MRHLARALSLAALFVPTAAHAEDGPILLSPEAIGQIFCIARIGNDMSPVSGIVTADLAANVTDALHRSGAWAEAHPDEKPPLGDGVPWASFPDYAPECTVGPVALADGKALVTINYGFPDYPEANTSDELALVGVLDDHLGANRWRIDNVVFAHGYDLRQALNQAFVDFE